MDEGYGETALMIASENGNLELVQYFVENEANINAEDDNGWTALMKALANKHFEIASFLLDNGANVKN
ncbi:ankyrin repeat domain-containing protein [Brachyspira aalborgi]|uniref:ankyrin repeat domain-containing protein n=1 Tax=Brachyspira aalborgi TaxID=29522 RepID=UPI00237BE486|nr:ankyrin repeat domain-containing protein [Brachyspira aalborgi]